MSRIFHGLLVVATSLRSLAGTGDPQLRTGHPWYPGELAMSTFERLAVTQAEQWQRITGNPVRLDEDRAPASWFWRNTHYAQGEEGTGDYFDAGFGATRRALAELKGIHENARKIANGVGTAFVPAMMAAE